MELEHVPCDLCGGKSYRIRYRKPDNWLRLNLFQFPVVECDDCGLVYVNPRPTMEAMGAFYPNDYHSGRNAASFTTRYRAQKRFLPALAGKRVLDIGCAHGDFLTFLLQTEDFDAHGIDAFSDGVDNGRIQFTQGTLPEAGYRPGEFDLVMSWAVFEHLHQPTDYFAEAARILTPGGQLVILVTNADSFYGRVAHMEDVPRHTYHYTERILAEYANKCGLRLASVTFDDTIFDGRGKGSLRMLAGRLSGFSWEKFMRNQLRLHTRIFMKLGGALDVVCFASHWETFFRRSGIMIAKYEKP